MILARDRQLNFSSLKVVLRLPIHSCPSMNGVFRKAMDTQFIIIVDKDTMVSIIYPKCDDAVVHQIAEIYYGIHSIPKILLWYIITKYPNMLPRYLKENQSPLITSWHFLFICF